MYYFEDTVKKKHQDDRILPSSAMLYDGIYLEKQIDGYRTLSVSGREMLSVELETESRKIGSVKVNQKLPARTIKVTYQLVGKNAEDVQKKYHQLMYQLYREDEVEIRFRDDEEFFYRGQYSIADEVSGDRNSIVSSFELFCQDPRKYSRLLQTSSEITTYLPYQTRPEKIEVVTERFGPLIISTENKSIRITNYNLNKGVFVVVDFKKGKIFVNGIDQTFLLDLDSDFENFYLEEGQNILCDNGQMIIFYREVRL